MKGISTVGCAVIGKIINLGFVTVTLLCHTEASLMTFPKQHKTECVIPCISIPASSITAIYPEQMMKQSCKPVTLKKADINQK